MTARSPDGPRRAIRRSAGPAAAKGATSVPNAQTYTLLFLTDAWEWDDAVIAPTLDRAKALARDALERVVREESPGLACVTLGLDGRKLGVWDWVAGQFVWSAL